MALAVPKTGMSVWDLNMHQTGSLQHQDREGNLAVKKFHLRMSSERVELLLQDNA